MATLDTILNIEVKGTDSMVKLQTAIDKTAKDLKDLKKEGKQAGESQEQFNAKIVTAETKLKGLRGELTKGKTELIKNAKAVSDNSGSYNSLVKQNAKLSQELRKLSDPLGKNKKKFEELSGSIKSNTDKLKNMDAQMGRQQRNVGNYGSALGGLTKSFGLVATAVTGAIMVFKTFQRGIQEFTDFQFQIKQVGVISGASAEQMDMLTESAKELGRTTSFTAGEVAGLQVELAKLGFDPTEIENMTASALDLAFVFDVDLASAGETIGGILNSFQLDASETARVTDVLATAFSNSALDMTKFTTAFPKVGAVANAVGFDLEDVTSLMGILADKSLDASVIGTSLRNIFLKMADSGSDLSKALGGSVTSVDQLIPALQKLTADGIDVTEMLGLTDTRSVTAFASLLSGSQDVDVLNTKLRESTGALETFADEMRDSLKGSIDATTSSISGFVIEMVEGLEPAIRLVIDGVGLLFGGLTKLIENIEYIVAPLVAYKVTMLAVNIQQKGFATALGLSKISLKSFGISMKAGTISVKAFNKAIKLNPIGLLVSGLTLGIVALSDWIFGTDDATESTEDMTDALEDENKELTRQEKLQKDVTDSREKYTKSQNEEIAQAKVLVETIKNTNLSLKEREDALASFNKMAGTNISNLLSEKEIIQQVENSYQGLVNAIKERIIIQASEKEISLLIERQLELSKEIKENDEKLLTTKQALADGEKERAEKGVRTTEQLIEDGDRLKNNNRAVLDGINDTNNSLELNLENIKNLNFETNDYSNELKNNIDLMNLNNESVGDRVGAGHQLSNQLKVEATETVNGIELQTTALEDNILSLNAKSDVMIANANIENSLESKNIVLKTEMNSLEQQIKTSFEERVDALDSLNISTTSFNSKTGETINLLRDMKSAIADEERELKNLIVTREQKKQLFLNSAQAETMTEEQKAKRIEEINVESNDAIEKATNDLKKSKEELANVEKELTNVAKKYNATVDDQGKTIQQQITDNDKIVDGLKLQEQALKDLEKVNADVGKERIQMSLKVAQAELKSALLVAQATGDTSQATVDRINELQNNIANFQNKLQSLGGDGQGFLESAVFGHDPENGEPLTGQQLMDGINVTLDTVSNTLDAFNQLQQERLNTQLGVIERAKNEEIENFKETAEYEIMTDEERATAIEDIEKKHDAEMLKLKIEQWKKDKALAKTQAIIGGAQAIMNILSAKATGNAIADAIIKAILITGTIGMTAMQIATINAQAPPTAELGGIMDDSFFAKGGMVQGKSHAQGGEKFAVGGRVVELEGGESVINKRSTAMFKPILSQLNVAGGGRKFADGGIVMDTDALSSESTLAESIIGELNNQQVLLVEADVTNSQKSVKNIESRISF